jgi:hypothetical protein
LSGSFFEWNGVAHAFVISGGKPEDRDAAIALLQRFDVPEPRVDKETAARYGRLFQRTRAGCRIFTP